jgi:hypothetical protein
MIIGSTARTDAQYASMRKEHGPRLYLNTYAPLVWSRYGRDASATLGLSPFIDGSIRREPDLEHPYPSISCLCRADRFAPRLRAGDVVVYMTKKNRYDSAERHHRLTAILQVLHSFDDHRDAAAWYAHMGLPLPSNCLVRGNGPCSVSHSHRVSRRDRRLDDRTLQRLWDSGYQERVSMFPQFVVCAPRFVDLSWQAPIVHDEDLIAVFGRVPGTHNPGALDIRLLDDLTRRLNLKLAPPSAPRIVPAAGPHPRTAGPTRSGRPVCLVARPPSECSPRRRKRRGRSRGGC